MAFKVIDSLIDYLKGDDPYKKADAFKLWQALKMLSDGIVFLERNTNSQISFISAAEIPTGVINGSNTIYMLRSKPIDSFAALFQNGLLLIQDVDYTINNQRITMATAPIAGDTLQFLYSIRRS